MTELHIPDESTTKLREIVDDARHTTTVYYPSDSEAAEDVDAIARPVLVAYLREEAQRAARMDVPAAHQWLTECADELEAGS